MKYNELSPEESYVIEHKGTERPFSGKYNDFYKEGTYLCKKCNAPLYKSESKFTSGCGWPSFDDEIKGAVKRVPDKDGRRTEIVCASCGAHLGHVFEGEGFTSKDTRHCVNSISLKFEDKEKCCEEHAFAYFAAGCFWGVEHQFEKFRGVHSAVSGYMGGHFENPTYQAVCTGMTGHLETVRVEYDECVVSFKELAKHFFEIHNFTQTDGQGPDIGNQYLSAIFYVDEKQKQAALELIDQLEDKGYKVATSLYEASKFYEAEEYHQDYYAKTGKTPYCHTYKKIF
ncbi:bifunctional methionine sulfoxide reductase B/A protein [Halarcobacter anaerophilus]|uniref:Peptide methionine sulfoxide reductase MsrA n=1 Tax=Halarcobacter anaerophilus TaxID=877500 RepID=A0A4Q0XYA6_9BACT|nr:bifunctional methionine sulfoxide reductase B/A protein [Halarcobacter anaerophilus]QDF29748.1 S-isomer-specific methionine sulfoxide reductase [Halarcobacter anaerophilus]RXJ62670.1 methionine sulfoxide reductase [Halarcobacter anaerophilus]